MKFLPLVIEAEYRGGYLINLKFNDGVEQIIDFAQWLEGPVFEPLKDVSYFQRFFLDGGTVAWPNGADVAPRVGEGASGGLTVELGSELLVVNGEGFIRRALRLGTASVAEFGAGLRRR